MSSVMRQVLVLAVCLLILRVTGEIVWGYRNYFPPDFNSDFLRGRESYFFGPYQAAFYVHIATGPVAMLGGLLLISERFRRRWPKWHRRLGRVHTVNVLFLVTPSGLWMAWYASTGRVAVVGFLLLSMLTGTTAACGWRAAVARRFQSHRQWMWRCFLLLCSAIVLRVLGGLGVVSQIQADWYDPLASWMSWVAPLACYEIFRHTAGNK